MKPRKVFVTLELETDAPLALLRQTWWWSESQVDITVECLQAQANVAQTKLTAAGRKYMAAAEKYRYGEGAATRRRVFLKGDWAEKPKKSPRSRKPR